MQGIAYIIFEQSYVRIKLSRDPPLSISLKFSENFGIYNIPIQNKHEILFLLLMVKIVFEERNKL